MCGIAGIVNFQQVLKDTQQIQHMTDVLAHRGPDAQAIWTEQHVQLGHRRLAVIDVAGGAQPMTKMHYTIVYNGELYNTEELRQTLIARGYTFTTTSDTEVLLCAFIEWKEHCVEHLNGIFAFAVWDANEQSIYLFRDRLGVKPLFYTQSMEGLLFGSEIKALLAHQAVRPIVTYEGLTAFLSIGPSRKPGTTVFKNIMELPPAHALRFNQNGIASWCYWDVTSKEHTDTLEQTIEHVRELTTDAIQRQLVSDVPLCTLLSGGLDSSIITAVAAQTLKDQLHTYSIDYEDNEQFFAKNDFQTTRDGYWINIMSQQFNTVHHEVIVKQEQLVAYLRQALQGKDYPSMVDIDSSLVLFGQEIKKDFTVALSGECADELFGGYPWFYNATPYFPWIRSSDERAQLLQEHWQKKLPLKDYLQQTYDDEIKKIPVTDKRQQLFYLNRQYFMQTLLERKDRMTMAAGLEVRVPFADHRLVDYVWNIPWEMKTIGGLEKGILRKSFEGILPQEVLYRKKNPYPKTYHPKYTNGVKKILQQRLENQNSILHELFDAQKLQELIQSSGSSFKVPWFGQLMAGPQLLAFLVQIDMWFEEYNIELVEH
ncbi:asparagine synthase (glutamine-hydrolyzing) [Metasolibacillus sp.]|uniref:asparagine synthase (glutamine-hydrolyzing) n=1 Tax=Metasolibacillus sp. TaxID=2703680 RepID=UPI0025E00BD1|nr:asparagine synthase (glutamine-hydrolyzing) [Metasolibacillus sp.]MCT6926317.1 asparagine synthase (glutamine-hydrolyzing) [Metasolibacillus sp.]MCT6942566.1 asparagine synthase (glutamine-hydrolyzing) [Metasolibacillus sp.]